MIRQNVRNRQERRKRKIFTVGMAAVLALSPIPRENVSAKPTVPSLTKSITVNKGKTKTITIQANGNKMKKVTWKTSNKNIATVSASGKLKGKIKAVKKI